MIKLDLIPVQAYWLAIGVLSLALVGQELRVFNLKTDVAKSETALAQEKSARSAETTARSLAALAHTKQIAQLQSEHASNTQIKENEYADKLKSMEAANRAGAATADRLRNVIDTYATRDRRPGETDAVAVERFADRLGVVSGLLSESVSLVTESRSVIGERDAQVMRLLDQIRIDRLACTAPAGASGAPKP